MNVESLAGQILGKYTLTEKIGSGAMSVVYRGYQADLKREVAVKILTAVLANQPTYLTRFNLEAQTSAQLEHPHIVPVYDHGTEHGHSYIVMRLLRGGTLAQRLAGREQSPLPMHEIREIIKALANALDYAHHQGVIHRDIKPNNIMFDSNNEVYLVDFGIARLSESASVGETGVIIGTPTYMSPEQWRADPVVRASDQYALGVVIYELLTGRLPFEGTTPYELMHKHINETPLPVSQLRRGISPAIDQVIERAMAKKPEDRFPSVSAFAAAFNHVITSEAETEMGKGVEPSADDTEPAHERALPKDSSILVTPPAPKITKSDTIFEHAININSVINRESPPTPQTERRHSPFFKILIIGAPLLLIVAAVAAISLSASANGVTIDQTSSPIPALQAMISSDTPMPSATALAGSIPSGMETGIENSDRGHLLLTATAIIEMMTAQSAVSLGAVALIDTSFNSTATSTAPPTDTPAPTAESVTILEPSSTQPPDTATPTQMPTEAIATVIPTEITVIPTTTLIPTRTPIPMLVLPTITPLPIETSLPIATPLPTQTELPTKTALPTQTAPPTTTLIPSQTFTSTATLTPFYVPTSNQIVVVSGDSTVSMLTAPNGQFVRDLPLDVLLTLREVTTDRQWADVILPDGRSGWIPAGTINLVRAEPGPQGEVLARIPSGSRLELLGQSNDGAWFNVRLFNGIEGWMATQLVTSMTATAAPSATVTRDPNMTYAPSRPAVNWPNGTTLRIITSAQDVWVRARPSSRNNSVVMRLANNNPVTATGNFQWDGRQFWFEIRTATGLTGWVEQGTLAAQ